MYSDFVHGGGVIRAPGAKSQRPWQGKRTRNSGKEGKYCKQAKRVTFNAIKEIYLTNARLNKRPASVTRNEVSIKALMPHFKGVPLKKIFPDAVEAFKGARIAEEKTPATVNLDVAILKNINSSPANDSLMSLYTVRGDALVPE